MTRKRVNLAIPNALSMNKNGFILNTDGNGRLIVTGAAESAANVVLDLALMRSDDTRGGIPLAANVNYSWSICKNGVQLAEYTDGLNFRIDYTDAQGGTVWSWNAQDISRPRAVNMIYLQKEVEVGSTNLCGIYEVMLNEGTEPLPYEPYFEGLRSAPTTEVVSVGVNLFGGNSIENPQYIGDYYCNPNGGFYEQTEHNCFFVPISGGKEYYLWSSNETLGTFSIIHFMTKYGELIEANSSLYSFKEGVVIAPNGAHYMRFSISKQTTSLYCINESNTAINGKYYPYVKHTLPIPEAVRPANGINENVYDYIEWTEDGSVKKAVECGVVDLRELYWEPTENAGWYNRALVGIAKMNVGLCDTYTFIPETAIEDSADKTIQIRADIMFIKDASITDASQITGTLIYGLAAPTTEDISDLITADNLIGVQDGGTITFKNEYNYAVPNEVMFYEGNNEIISADIFVGNLTGIAARAISDKNGNDISSTYATKDEVIEAYDLANDAKMTADDKVSKSGDTIDGILQVNAPIFGYNYGNSNNAPAFVFDKAGINYTGIGANGEADTILFAPVTSDGTYNAWVSNYTQKWKFQGDVIANNFTGNLNGTATNATNDGNGNSIADTYVKQSITLANGTDLNTVVTSGFYRLTENHVNGPKEANGLDVGIQYGQLIVSRGADTITQMVFTYYSSRMFIRCGNPSNTGGSSSWTDWEEVITSGNISSQSVDSATNDGNGKSIADTYATKDDLNNAIALAITNALNASY